MREQMRFRAVCPLALVLAASAFAPAARADDKADIKAVYAKIIAAMKKKDTKAIMALGTPDFKSKEINGQILDAKQSEQLNVQFAMMKSMDAVEINPEKIEVKGNK